MVVEQSKEQVLRYSVQDLWPVSLLCQCKLQNLIVPRHMSYWYFSVHISYCKCIMWHLFAQILFLCNIFFVTEEKSFQLGSADWHRCQTAVILWLETKYSSWKNMHGYIVLYFWHDLYDSPKIPFVLSRSTLLFWVTESKLMNFAISWYVNAVSCIL